MSIFNSQSEKVKRKLNFEYNPWSDKETISSLNICIKHINVKNNDVLAEVIISPS